MEATLTLPTLPYAVFGRRLYAYLIDQSLIQVAGLILLSPYLYSQRAQFLGVFNQITSLANPVALSQMQPEALQVDQLLISLLTILIIYLALIFVIGMIYGVVMETSARGATLGKRHCGLRVTDIYGQQIKIVPAITRNIGVNLPSLLINFDLLITTIVLVGYALPMLNRRRQALYDMFSGCVVVTVDKPKAASIGPSMVNPD